MFLNLKELLLTTIDNRSASTLFKLADEYMRTAVMGNFSFRLRGLFYLGYIDEDIAEEKSPFDLSAIIRRTHSYYMQYYSRYLSKVMENRAEHEKDCMDYVVLAGWDSKHYSTLKATVEKFQKKVHRIMKRYRDFLQEPIAKNVLQAQRDSSLVDSYLAFHN